jgi:hypothetical protein
MTAWPPPPPVHQPPPKPRPSGWWFVVGGGLMVVGLAVGVTAFVLLFRGIMATDASLPVDGVRHRVSVPTDGDRMIWADTRYQRPECTVVDRASGAEIALAPTSGDFERNDQKAIARFDPGSGDLDVTCEGDTATSVDIGPSPGTAGLVGGILLAVLAPLLLGGLGFVVVLVTGVLWSSRPPRPTRL